jgi:hypothetical protein
MQRQKVRPPHARQAPFFVGIDVGKRPHYAAMVDANGMGIFAQPLEPLIR